MLMNVPPILVSMVDVKTALTNLYVTVIQVMAVNVAKLKLTSVAQTLANMEDFATIC
jgi:hypothetical protein